MKIHIQDMYLFLYNYFIIALLNKVKPLRRICPASGAATPPPWCPPSPVGLYNVIRTTTDGFEIGATPTNIDRINNTLEIHEEGINVKINTLNKSIEEIKWRDR